MAGPTAGDPLDGLIDGARDSLTVALPAAADVEAELQRIARQRADGGSSSHRGIRSLKQRRQPLAGAFDSPEGFAFVSDEERHHR
jgi:hypothetical protein